MGYLKGKSSLMIYEKYPELRYKYRNREFWYRGYYVDTAGKNANRIAEYIKRQLEEDRSGEQLTMGNLLSPFTGGRQQNSRGCQTVLARRDAPAGNKGLCPYRKNPRLCRGFLQTKRNTEAISNCISL